MNTRIAALVLALGASVTYKANAADEQPYAFGIAFGVTQLGQAAPSGFGITGGPTIKAYASKSVGAAYLAGAVRVFGVERPEPRTVGVEVDIGAGAAKHLLTSHEVAVVMRGQIACGAYRVPLETALTRMRFIGLRPGVELVLDVRVRTSLGVSVSADARWYNTPVWTGWSIGVLGGGWMRW